MDAGGTPVERKGCWGQPGGRKAPDRLFIGCGCTRQLEAITARTASLCSTGSGSSLPFASHAQCPLMVSHSVGASAALAPLTPSLPMRAQSTALPDLGSIPGQAGTLVLDLEHAKVIQACVCAEKCCEVLPR